MDTIQNRWFFILDIFGNLICYTFSYPGHIGNQIFSIFSYPGNADSRRACSFGQVFPAWVILTTLVLESPGVLEILKIWFLFIIMIFPKRPAPKAHAEPTGFRPEISHNIMTLIQGQTPKLFKVLISRWCRRRWRQRTDISPIWPEPWLIVRRDEIPCSGECITSTNVQLAISRFQTPRWSM